MYSSCTCRCRCAVICFKSGFRYLMETIENNWTALQINVLEKGPGAITSVCHTAVVSKFSSVMCRTFLCDSFSFRLSFSDAFRKIAKSDGHVSSSVDQHGTTRLPLDGFDEI